MIAIIQFIVALLLVTVACIVLASLGAPSWFFVMLLVVGLIRVWSQRLARRLAKRSRHVATRPRTFGSRPVSRRPMNRATP